MKSWVDYKSFFDFLFLEKDHLNVFSSKEFCYSLAFWNFCCMLFYFFLWPSYWVIFFGGCFLLDLLLIFQFWSSHVLYSDYYLFLFLLCICLVFFYFFICPYFNNIYDTATMILFLYLLFEDYWVFLLVFGMFLYLLIFFFSCSIGWRLKKYYSISRPKLNFVMDFLSSLFSSNFFVFFFRVWFLLWFIFVCYHFYFIFVGAPTWEWLEFFFAMYYFFMYSHLFLENFLCNVSVKQFNLYLFFNLFFIILVGLVFTFNLWTVICMISLWGGFKYNIMGFL